MLVLAALLEHLLEKYGPAGIGHESSGSGQENIASAILHFHTTPEKGGETSHIPPSVPTR